MQEFFSDGNIFDIVCFLKLYIIDNRKIGLEIHLA